MDSKINNQPIGQFGGAYHKVFVRGRYVYAAKAGGLVVIDVTDPTSPQEVDFYPTRQIINVHFFENHLYLADISGLRIFDISNPQRLCLISELDLNCRFCNFSENGSFVCFVLSNKGLCIVNIADPNNPRIEGKVEFGGFAEDLSVFNAHAYIADVSGLKIAYVGDVTRPFLIGRLGTPGWPKDIWVSGDYGYLADVCSLKILDLSNPSKPILKGMLTNPTWKTTRIFVEGNHAYLADEANGLKVVDVSNPSNPVLRGELCTDGGVWDVFVEGNHAYLADFDKGLKIADVSKIEEPILINELALHGRALGIFKEGEYVYIACGESGLMIVDGSDPAEPKLKGNLVVGGICWDVFVKDDLGYLAAGEAGFSIFQGCKSGNPVIVSQVKTYEARGISVQGSEVFLADGREGLKIIDVTDSHNPIIESSFGIDGFTRSTFLSDKYIYVAGGDGGMLVFQLVSRG